MRRLINIGLTICLLLLCTVCSDKDQLAAVEEIYQDDEAQQADIAVKNFRKLLLDYKTDHVARGAHAKAHACVRAYFNVNENVDSRFRYGVFSTPGKRYKAWIRFSNGHFDLSVSRDQKDDARGMAIKVLAPPGTPIEIAANQIPTQDFLMTNSTVFFIKNIEDYNALVAKPEDLLGFIFPGWNPLNWRISELFLAKKTLTTPPASPLSPQYYSITAYKLGPNNIKFSARPCEGQVIEASTDVTNPDFLRENLTNELKTGDACFDFMIQLQIPEKNMSIEDPTIEWSEADSPFIPLARITIPSQEFDSPTQRIFCENLSFSPWHALEAQRPIGQFNRMRRTVYRASSNFRHEQNHTVVPTDLYW